MEDPIIHFRLPTLLQGLNPEAELDEGPLISDQMMHLHLIGRHTIQFSKSDFQQLSGKQKRRREILRRVTKQAGIATSAAE